MRTTIALLALSVVALGCGGPESNMPPGGGDGRPTPPASAPAPAAAAAVPQGPVNEKYEIIAPFYKEALKRSLDGKVNLFRTNLDKFTPTVEIEAEPEVTTTEAKTPLEYYDADSYKLVLIMSGTAQAKALVIDPRDKSYVIQVGTLIGNRNGKVTSITSSTVVID
ncbi:MAG TPA: hypothetical protein GX737_04910, partial [Oligoflexales bacterium]|nr:hypothetical protein [Oligoflexales bacterium]